MTESFEDEMSFVPESSIEISKQIDSNGNEFWSARDLMRILGYANFARFKPVILDIHSSLSLENPSQNEILPASSEVQIGSGAIRKVEDWHLSSLAMERLLSRAASHKPEAVRELRKRSNARLRIEVEIGVVLLDFCEQAGLTITQQKTLGKYRFDYCIDNRLLIEVDELGHKDILNRRKDKIKTAVAEEHGYKLLRITIPINNVAKLCGMITRLLTTRS